MAGLSSFKFEIFKVTFAGEVEKDFVFSKAFSSTPRLTGLSETNSVNVWFSNVTVSGGTVHVSQAHTGDVHIHAISSA